LWQIPYPCVRVTEESDNLSVIVNKHDVTSENDGGYLQKMLLLYEVILFPGVQ
jgi:hypothetical protein